MSDTRETLNTLEAVTDSLENGTHLAIEAELKWDSRRAATQLSKDVVGLIGGGTVPGFAGPAAMHASDVARFPVVLADVGSLRDLAAYREEHHCLTAVTGEYPVHAAKVLDACLEKVGEAFGRGCGNLTARGIGYVMLESEDEIVIPLVFGQQAFATLTNARLELMRGLSETDSLDYIEGFSGWRNSDAWPPHLVIVEGRPYDLPVELLPPASQLPISLESPQLEAYIPDDAE